MSGQTNRLNAGDLLKTLIFLLLGVLLVWLVVRNLTEKDKAEIWTSFSGANLFALFLVFVFGLASNIIRALRWQMLMKPLGKTPGSVNTFLAVNVAYIANLAVPRLGEISRCGVINRYEKIPVDKALGTVVTERITDTLTLMVVCLLTVLFQFDVLESGIRQWIWIPLSSKFQAFKGNGSLLFFFALIAVSLLALVIFRKQMLSNRFIQKLIKITRGFSGGILSVFQLERKLLFLLYSILIWVFYLLAIYAGFNTLSSTASLGIGAALSVLFFGTFAFIAVQGGIGAYQIIVMNTLALYHIPLNAGFALGWLVWGTQAGCTVIIGALSLALLPVINKNKS